MLGMIVIILILHIARSASNAHNPPRSLREGCLYLLLRAPFEKGELSWTPPREHLLDRCLSTWGVDLIRTTTSEPQSESWFQMEPIPAKRTAFRNELNRIDPIQKKQLSGPPPAAPQSSRGRSAK